MDSLSDSIDLGREDMETALTRHRKELREQETKNRFTLKQAKNKAKKTEVEAQVVSVCA